MKCSLGISNFFPFYCFPLFLCIVHLRRLSYLSLLFFGMLHSNGYIFPFLLCFSLPFFSQLFVRPPQIAVLLFCISFYWGWSSFLSPVQCYEPLSIVHQARSMSGVTPGSDWESGVRLDADWNPSSSDWSTLGGTWSPWEKDFTCGMVSGFYPSVRRVAGTLPYAPVHSMGKTWQNISSLFLKHTSYYTMFLPPVSHLRN